MISYPFLLDVLNYCFAIEFQGSSMFSLLLFLVLVFMSCFLNVPVLWVVLTRFTAAEGPEDAVCPPCFGAHLLLPRIASTPRLQHSQPESINKPVNIETKTRQGTLMPSFPLLLY